MKMSYLFLFVVWLCISCMLHHSGGDLIVEEKLALLDFAIGIHHERGLNWQATNPACGSWVGVYCSSDDSRVAALHLPGIGFGGAFPPNTLGRLTSLQALSLRNNAITGPFPAELLSIPTLTLLNLEHNNFSGPLPGNFTVWSNLTVLDLSFNHFNGSVPASLSDLTQLNTLNLANNSFTGNLPDHLNLSSLQSLSLANNMFTGIIPAPLRRFPSSSFEGNNFTTGVPPPFPSPSPESPPASSPVVIPEAQHKKRKKKIQGYALLGIIVGACVLCIVSLVVLLMVCYSRRKYRARGDVDKLRKNDRSSVKTAAGSQEENNNRIVFFGGSRYAFDLEDLLRASAEVLGKGAFGTAYKAALEDATPVVVKRLKDVAVGRREFEQQMEVVGRVRHENVVALRAYYYSKDEKLVIYDYYSEGSVSALLHGSRGEGRILLDWDTRVKIAVGTARAIAHIHSQNSGKLIHGNIKSSNIFLNFQRYGCVSDLGLASLMNIPSPYSRSAGYRAPELVDARKASHASDVYSVGVVLFELLTGKSPVQTSAGGEIVHLVRWVQSVVREEWTAEVFDVELMRYPNIEEELVEMLQIGMSCVARSPDQRPKMAEVVRMIEEVRRIDTGNRPSSEGRSGDRSGEIGHHSPPHAQDSGANVV